MTSLLSIRFVRAASSASLMIAALFALAGCTSRAAAPDVGTLDLGGGITMTASGEIRGATPAWASSVPTDVADSQVAEAANPYPPEAATPFYFRSAAQWQQYTESKLTAQSRQ